jgi:putative ABC transport system ATP-binding protein
VADIARAFANDPKIIFADEPTGNLDTANTYEMMNLMTSMAKASKQTMVLVTHDNEISGYASRIIRIRDGKIEKIENGRDHNDEKANG